MKIGRFQGNMYACIGVYASICLYVCMYVCMYACIGVYASICTYHMYVCMYSNMYVCMFDMYVRMNEWPMTMNE